MIPIILDCDPGHDDAIAILYAARCTDLRAITTVFGNSSSSDTTRNALRICELGRIDVPVAQGCDGPLLGVATSKRFHGADGLAGAPHLPEPTRRPANQHAVSLIIETARAAPGDVTLVATGALTNIALALRFEPRLAKWLRSISIMGGSTDIGNETPFAEANIFRDPEAADIVLGSGLEIRLAGLNLTRQARIGSDVARHLRTVGGAVPTVVAEILDFYLSLYQRRNGSIDAPMHDPTALVALVRPDLITYRSLPVSVQLAPGPLRGMTAFDLRGFQTPPDMRPARPDILVGMTMDGAAAVSHVFDIIAGYADTGG